MSSLSQAPVSGNPDNPRDQDLFDFADQLRRMVGDDAQASVSVNGAHVTLALDWDDSRVEETGHRQTLTLSSLTQAIRP